MKRFVTIVVALLCSSACSTILGTGGPHIPPKSEAMELLTAAPVCCQTIAQLPFRQISPGFNEAVEISGDEPVYEFPSGRSFVEGFRLPVNRAGYSIVVRSEIRNGELFSPYLLVLNDKFEIVERVAAEQFTYVPASGMTGDTVAYSLNIVPELGASYLVVMTTTEAMTKTTKYISAAKAYALANNVADPGVPDPEAIHSPVGLIALQVEGTFVAPVGAQKDAVDQWFAGLWGTSSTPDAVARPADYEAVARAVPDSSAALVIAPAAVSSTAAVAPTAASAPAGTMMAETEAMYNEMITKTVASRDIDKALKLVDEAERAGSASARKVFIDEVKKLK